jgi:sugar (pentulose or hexulose) kinase
MGMAKYLAGIDLGTSGARCALLDLKGKIVASEYREYGSTYPKPGWVEQDLDEMVTMTMEACRKAIAKSGVNPKEIAAIGFSTQRSVTVPVYADGSKVRPMLSWQDARTGAEVADMLKLIDAQRYYDISGMPMGTTWNITKILWMRKNEPELFQKTHKFVQVQDAVLKAFGAEDFCTDTSDMAFYGIWDVAHLEWSQELCGLFGVTPEMFGKPVAPGTRVAEVTAAVAEKSGFAVGTPICVGAGDQNCGVVGMGSVRSGMVTVNLGTGGLVALTLDKHIQGFGGMMITNHASAGMWQMEGLSNAAGSSYRWFRDVIGTQEKELEKANGRSAYEYLNDLAGQSVPGSKGLLFMPYLGTAATPRWNSNARASFVGLSFAHGRAEMARAILEGVALEMRDIIEGWLKAGVEITTMRLGGGVTKSPLWNQIQADVYGRPVETLKIGESTVLGAAIFGGVGAGLFSSITEGADVMVAVADKLEPNMQNHRLYEEMYQAYVKTYDGLCTSGAFDQLAKIQSA